MAFGFMGFGQVEPMIQNNWQTFQWPYNAYYPEDDNGVNGHVGNACGYTSLARICHYWQYPSNGNGILDFDDYWGNHWYVDFENLNLDFQDMPYALDWDDPESVYEQTAKLFLACGAISEDIQIGFTDGIMRIPDAMGTYMNYSSEMDVIQRWDYTREEWIALFKNELDNGRPIMIDGRTEDSPAPWEPGGWQGHFFVCDGYNEADEFYMNYMFGGIAGYYDIDNMGDYKAYHRAIVNFEPYNVGLHDVRDLEASIAVYPNPCTENFRIQLENPSIQKVQINLLDGNGKTVRQIADRVFNGRQQFTTDVSALSKGVYFLYIKTGNKQEVKKLLVR